MTVCKENFYHAKDLEKRVYNKSVKSKSYTSGNKVWLNNKYIKTKQNQKFDVKFFGPFQALHPVNKQAYKLKLPK